MCVNRCILLRTFSILSEKNTTRLCNFHLFIFEQTIRMSTFHLLSLSKHNTIAHNQIFFIVAFKEINSCPVFYI